MQSQAHLNFAEVQPKIAKSNLNNMVVLVTGANGQLGNEMRIIAQNSTDKYIFTDVNQAEGVETAYLDITDLEAIRKIVSENDVKAIGLGTDSEYYTLVS